MAYRSIINPRLARLANPQLQNKLAVLNFGFLTVLFISSSCKTLNPVDLSNQLSADSSVALQSCIAATIKKTSHQTSPHPTASDPHRLNEKNKIKIKSTKSAHARAKLACLGRSLFPSPKQRLRVNQQEGPTPSKLQRYLKGPVLAGESFSSQDGNVAFALSDVFDNGGGDITSTTASAILKGREARYSWIEDFGEEPADSMEWDIESDTITDGITLSVRVGPDIASATSTAKLEFQRIDFLRIVLIGDGPQPLTVNYNGEEYLNLLQRSAASYQCYAMAKISIEDQESLHLRMSLDYKFGGYDNKADFNWRHSSETLELKAGAIHEYYWKDHPEDFIGPKMSTIQQRCVAFQNEIRKGRYIERGFEAKAKNWRYYNPKSVCTHDDDCIREWETSMGAYKAWTVPRCIVVGKGGAARRECRIRSPWNGDCPLPGVGVMNAWACDRKTRTKKFERSSNRGPLYCQPFYRKRLWGLLPNENFGLCRGINDTLSK